MALGPPGLFAYWTKQIKGRHDPTSVTQKKKKKEKEKKINHIIL